MLEGLWTVEFGTSAGMFGGGVAVFQDGKILGGDGTYFYVGNYKVTGQTVEASLKISPFIKGAASVFKTVGQELSLELVGVITPDGIVNAQGQVTGKPYPKFAAKLVRRS